MKYFMVKQNDVDSNKFMFNAKNHVDARDKLNNWLSYHGLLKDSDNFSLKEVNAFSEDWNINYLHNEYII